MTATIDHRQLYRLPWSLPDNAIAWLEPTKKCNLACLGCYRENDPRGHKTLDEVRHDLEVFKRFRTVDGVSIAGGDPLVHPEIVEIVRLVAREGLKPIVNTNGLALTEELLRELKGAGVAGFTFHIDSKQGRPGWKKADEIELCELRQHYAEMVAATGGMGCSFNATVYEDTLRYVPDIVQWAQRNVEIVHTIVFIAFRAGVVGGSFEQYVRGVPVDFSTMPYATTDQTPHELQSTDIVAEIRKRFPDFAPAAYLNGTERPDTFKWLLTGRLATKERVYGYVGPRSMELAQTFHHLATGRYLAYTGPQALSTWQGDAAFVRARPAPAEDRPPLAESGCPQALTAASEAPLPVGDDHPAGRHLRRRTAEHVRRLPRYDGVERPPRLVVQIGGARALRGLRADGAQGRLADAGLTECRR